MRPATLLALCSVLVCCFGTVGMAQASEAQALYAALLMDFPQETAQTRQGVFTAEAGQRSAVKGTCFAFDPTFRNSGN